MASDGEFTPIGRIRPTVLLVVATLGTASLAGCRAAATSRPDPAPTARSSVTMVFAGDLMLGRGVAPIAAADPWSVLEGVKPKFQGADVAAANLESPLTSRPHTSSNPNALEADPVGARILAAAGLDAVSVANNHAGDAGMGSVEDTLRALSDVGVAPLGGGTSDAQAFTPTLLHRNGLSIALLAFDATDLGLAASPTSAGVAPWDPQHARSAVEEARGEADLVAVSVHGGAEYHFGADPYLTRIASQLASWGADVVWCHGPHVVQPTRVVDPDGDGRPTLVATSLGNLLFDQGIPGTTRGAIIEARADASGVFAYRIGITETSERRVAFVRWKDPPADAAAFDAAWYTPTAPIQGWEAPSRPAELPTFDQPHAIDAAAVGDADGDGRDEVVVSYRIPFHDTLENAVLPRHAWVDDRGFASHLGVFRAGSLEPMWLAGTVVRPVAAVAPCGPAMAVAYSTLDSHAPVATALWRWRGFGFATTGELPGPGTPACADVDGDGNPEPVIVGRSPS